MPQKKRMLRMALVSMKHRLGDITFNLDRHRMWLERCLQAGARFIGFPEFSLTGWTFDPSQALPLESEPLAQIASWAKRHRVFIGTCFTEQSGPLLHNTSAIYGPAGRAGAMRKINLVRSEAEHYTPGRAFEVFDVAGCRMGIATCADATRYEMIHVLSLRGAEVIFAPHANTLGHYGNSPAGWLRWRMERWPLFARDCGVAIAGINNAGRFEKPLSGEQDVPYCGGGAVLDWEGRVVAKAPVRSKKECMVIADLDLASLRKARRANPLHREFRADIVYDSRANRLGASASEGD